MDGSTLDKQCLGMEGTRVDEGGGQRQVEGAELCGGLCCGARKGKGRKGQVCVKCTWSARWPCFQAPQLPLHEPAHGQASTLASEERGWVAHFLEDKVAATRTKAGKGLVASGGA